MAETVVGAAPSGGTEAGSLLWPEERVASAAVREWIGQTLHTTVAGPTVVYRPTDWGVVAGFETAAIGPVVCKIGYLPEDAFSPALYPLLGACARENVPRLLAGRHSGSQTWLLFAPFSGIQIRDLHALPPLITMARTFAHIQNAVSERLKCGSYNLSRLRVSRFPELFDAILTAIAEEEDWPEDISAEALFPFRPAVQSWADELGAGDWPDSIDHPDLHSNNAVLLENGDVLIFDWEGAIVTCPFFSLDNLVENAGRLDRGPDSPVPVRQPGGLAYTPSVLAVRNAYLEALPWKTFAKRERAFDVAQCLSRILRARQHLALFESLGSDRLAAVWGVFDKRSVLTYSLREARRRWEIMLENTPEP